MAKSRKTFKRVIREYEDSVTVENEQLEGYHDVKLPVKHKYNNGGFVTVFQQAMYNISTKANLTKGEMKLLIFLLGTAGMDNSICVDANLLASELDMKRPNVLKCLKGLTDRNIVIRVNGYRAQTESRTLPMNLSVNYDQINYDLAYNGKIKEFKKKKENHPDIEAKPLAEIEEAKPNLFSDPPPIKGKMRQLNIEGGVDYLDDK